MRVAAVVAFLLIPLAEIAALIQVGQVIGPWWTILLLIAMSVLGTWLIRREWRDTWRALNTALGQGRLPSRELIDAGLVVVGGTLLLTPGFLTDLVGFFVLLPLTRPIARRAVVALLARRVAARVVVSTAGPRLRPDRGPVIQGQVVDEDGPPTSR